jgi:hypothetical protein
MRRAELKALVCALPSPRRDAPIRARTLEVLMATKLRQPTLAKLRASEPHRSSFSPAFTIAPTPTRPLAKPEPMRAPFHAHQIPLGHRITSFKNRRRNK